MDTEEEEEAESTQRSVCTPPNSPHISVVMLQECIQYIHRIVDESKHIQWINSRTCILCISVRCLVWLSTDIDTHPHTVRLEAVRWFEPSGWQEDMICRLFLPAVISSGHQWVWGWEMSRVEAWTPVAGYGLTQPTPHLSKMAQLETDCSYTSNIKIPLLSP